MANEDKKSAEQIDAERMLLTLLNSQKEELRDIVDLTSKLELLNEKRENSNDTDRKYYEDKAKK
jgi:hypothetical protein